MWVAKIIPPIGDVPSNKNQWKGMKIELLRDYLIGVPI